MIKQVLTPIYTSFESAYIVESYPYGGYRTQAKFWIETNKKGQRVGFCTLNPKTQKWNNPKMGIYHQIVALFLDENNHVQNDAIGAYNTSLCGDFLEKYESGLLSYQAGKAWIFKALHEAEKLTGKSIYKGDRLEVWSKAKELLTEWNHSDLIEKIKDN